MNLIDTHAHLYYDRFTEDLDQVIQNALDAGVTNIINIGTDLESSNKALEFESNKIKFFASISLHPHVIPTLPTPESIHKYMEELEKMYHSNTLKIVAVGECGIDYHFEGIDYSPTTLSQKEQIKLQKELFKAQINFAKKLGLPLIIHSRDSWNDIFLPELSGAKGVFHSFTGTQEVAKQALDLGFYLGFSCIVTYPKNDHLREIIKNTPLDRILTETDAPYLPPQTLRGQRNEPSNVADVVKVIAEMKNISLEEVVNQTLENAKQLFKI